MNYKRVSFLGETWVSRSIRRSVEILISIPVVQCLAIALVSSDCVVKGGSIPTHQHGTKLFARRPFAKTTKKILKAQLLA